MIQPYVKYNIHDKYVSIHQAHAYIEIGLEDGLWADLAALNLVLFMWFFLFLYNTYDKCNKSIFIPLNM